MERAPSRKSWTSRWITAAVIVTLLLSSYSLFKVLTLKPGESAVVAPGISVEKPIVDIESVAVNSNGDLIVKYSNGNEQNVGQVRGSDGKAPSADIIATAVSNYCQSNKCDGYPPTQRVVLAAVMQYCSDGICKGENGENGRDAPLITPDQILAQVEQYCANGNCRGERGATGATGATGSAGKDARQAIWACVLTRENNVDVRYYSQKYADEPNAAYLTWEYRSKLPTWFMPNSCIDMRA